jgi:ribonuclease D
MGLDWIWVDSPEKMKKALGAMRRASRIGVDTEYDSFRYFREKLCLLQVRAESTTYLFDPLGSLDFISLGAIFADQGILKVLHAGDNDIRILKRDYSFEFCNLFDTSRAASILGCRYLSLAALICQYLDVEFAKQKKLQRSQWENRPLTEEQLDYAVRDTFYLIPLYEKLYQELRKNQRLEEAEKAFADITQVVWQEKTLDARGYSRIPGYYELAPDKQRVLKLLYRWRFNKAAESNRAAFMILSDTDLIAVTKAEADSPSRLVTEGRLSPEKVGRYGRELLEIISREQRT